jgi:hypothetical protein
MVALLNAITVKKSNDAFVSEFDADFRKQRKNTLFFAILSLALEKKKKIRKQNIFSLPF